MGLYGVLGFRRRIHMPRNRPEKDSVNQAFSKEPQPPRSKVQDLDRPQAPVKND